MPIFSLKASRDLTHDEKAIVARHLAVVEDYRRDCNGVFNNHEFDELDFYGVSVGYFVARGIGGADAFHLATLCRYVLEGFC